jgi:hypothetical protein
MHSLIISRGYPALSVQLNGPATTGTQLLRYIPATPQLDEQGNLRPVAEQMVVKYGVDVSSPSAKAAGEAAARAVVRNLNRIFTSAQLARKRRSKKGRAAVRFQVRSTDPEYYSEIHSGSAVFSSFESTYYEITVTLIRDPHLTATLGVDLAINGVTSGVTFTNGAGNSYSLDASTLAGDLPSPVMLEMVSNLPGGVETSEVFAGIHIGPSTWSGKLEAEAGTQPSGATSPVTAVTGASGNSVRRCDVLSYPDQGGTIPVSRYKIVEWTISPADVAAIDGRRMKPFVRLGTQLGTSDVQFAVNDEVRYVTAPTTKYWVELPSIPVPRQSVIGSSSDNGEDFTITLYGRRMSTGNYVADIDFICLVPVDSNRRYKSVGFASNQTLWDDPYEDVVYVRTTDTPARRRSTALAIGNPMMVYPGESHRLTIVHDGTMGIGAAWRDAKTLTVRAYAYPRRVNL